VEWGLGLGGVFFSLSFFLFWDAMRLGIASHLIRKLLSGKTGLFFS
jgi:hypothetical protein